MRLLDFAAIEKNGNLVIGEGLEAKVERREISDSRGQGEPLAVEGYSIPAETSEEVAVLAVGGLSGSARREACSLYERRGAHACGEIILAIPRQSICGGIWNARSKF